jgi:hypothetical protein
MVQVTFDTKNDSLEELKHALKILQDTIAKRHPTHAMDMPEEPALDTPFLKITVNKHEEHDESAEPEKEPTLNQLLNDDSLSDEDFSKMLKEQLATEKPTEPHNQDSDGYIEIIEYTEEKE